MRATTGSSPDSRRHLLTLAMQLVLMLATVAVSRLDLGVRPGVLVVMLLAAANATVVAVALMGIAREGTLVRLLAALTAAHMIGLLIWPAWDVAYRVRVF